GKTETVLQLKTGGIKSFTGENPLRFRLGRATVKRLHISGIPRGFEARVNGQSAQELTEDTAFFALPSEAGEVVIQLALPRVERPIAASVWQTQSQTLVRYAEGRLLFKSRLFAHADDGSGIEMLVALPQNAAS